MIYLQTLRREIAVHEEDIRRIDGRLVTLRSCEQLVLKEGSAVANLHRQLAIQHNLRWAQTHG